MQLDHKISGIEEKKIVLKEVCKTYNGEFVSLTKAAGEQRELSEMKILSLV